MGGIFGNKKRTLAHFQPSGEEDREGGAKEAARVE